MRVVMDIPDPTWYRLAGVAEESKVSVPALLVHAVDELIAPRPASETRASIRRMRVLAMHAEGHDNSVICERLGETRGYVQTLLRAEGLWSNPRVARGGKETNV